MSEFVWTDYDALDELQPPLWILSPAERRRMKAALVLLSVWGFVALLHLIPSTRWSVVAVAVLMMFHLARLVAASPADPVLPLVVTATPPDSPDPILPTVSILVPAKNESAVLPALVRSLSQLDYPAHKFDLWIIDDASTDDTPEQLTRLAQDYPFLQIYRRQPGSGGGKSGALNEVLPHTQGQVIAVFDADATVPADLLRRSLPLLVTRPGQCPVGALQVRKAIANPDSNFWIRGQVAEMALDGYLQQQRTLIGGVGELRGNGQLILRSVLQKCGGWNEATLTDDLDLTFKLHLAGVDVGFVQDPSVQEEGVTRWRSLWHQRNRWAEGGYQRFLDYWPGLLSNRLSLTKRLDLGLFFINQYLLPMAFLPDALWSLGYDHRTALWPIGLIAYLTLIQACWEGLRQTEGLRRFQLVRASIVGLVYMLHWLPIMIFTTARLCVQPKRLKWVKTEHRGMPHAS